MKKIMLIMFVVSIFSAVACSTPAPAAAQLTVAPTLAPIIEVPAVASHIDIVGVWNAVEAQPESTNTANVVFDRKKFEFTDNVVILDDLIVVEYEWLDTNRQIWKDTPATAGWGGLKINLLVSISREGDNLTIIVKDGYIKLQKLQR
jgi:hypothetical protein